MLLCSLLRCGCTETPAALGHRLVSVRCAFCEVPGLYLGGLVCRCQEDILWSRTVNARAIYGSQIFFWGLPSYAQSDVGWYFQTVR